MNNKSESLIMIVFSALFFLTVTFPVSRSVTISLRIRTYSAGNAIYLGTVQGVAQAESDLINNREVTEFKKH